MSSPMSVLPVQPMVKFSNDTRPRIANSFKRSFISFIVVRSRLSADERRETAANALQIKRNNFFLVLREIHAFVMASNKRT